ncbi:MAG: sulfite oxidase heme-binding subunit YedZ [Sphingomonadales bacterium]|jgi:sulfoxide reductase heme-binding subunit YedZ
MALNILIVDKRIKPILFFGMSFPVLWLLYGWYYVIGTDFYFLTANPIEYSNRFLGDWALRFILLGLSVTPLMDLPGFKPLNRVRRMVGLFAFFYVSLHLISYIALDHFFNWNEIFGDIIKRNFITVGMVAFILLLPLAITSNNKMQKRLTYKRWKKLHRLIYGISILGIFHYFMMIRGDQLEPKVYAGILFGLLGYRVVKYIKH